MEVLLRIPEGDDFRVESLGWNPHDLAIGDLLAIPGEAFYRVAGIDSGTRGDEPLKVATLDADLDWGDERH